MLRQSLIGDISRLELTQLGIRTSSDPQLRGASHHVFISSSRPKPCLSDAEGNGGVIELSATGLIWLMSYFSGTASPHDPSAACTGA